MNPCIHASIHPILMRCFLFARGSLGWECRVRKQDESSLMSSPLSLSCSGVWGCALWFPPKPQPLLWTSGTDHLSWRGSDHPGMAQATWKRSTGCLCTCLPGALWARAALGDGWAGSRGFWGPSISAVWLPQHPPWPCHGLAPTNLTKPTPTLRLLPRHLFTLPPALP